MSFKILVNENFKDTSIRELYNFINVSQSVDWGLFYYGFALSENNIKGRPKCGSIPTNYGCIIFPNFYYDEAKFLKNSEEYLPKEKLVDLKNRLEKDDFIDLENELDRDIIYKIASEHLDVVESSSIELILPVIIKIKDLPPNIKDALKLFQSQSKRMKKLKDFCDGIPPYFDDVEVHQWNLHYAEPDEIEEAIGHITEEEYKEEDFSMDYLIDEFIADLEEEPEEDGYVIILRTDQDANIKLRELEYKLDEALTPIKQYISKKTCFVTLVL
jgi:hypothetical protein